MYSKSVFVEFLQYSNNLFQKNFFNLLYLNDERFSLEKTVEEVN
jgi:hypothetical protein